MKKEYLIEPFNGKAIGVKKDQKVTVIDVKGKQVADFLQSVTESLKSFCRQRLHLIVMNLCELMLEAIYIAIFIAPCLKLLLMMWENMTYCFHAVVKRCMTSFIKMVRGIQTASTISTQD